MRNPQCGQGVQGKTVQKDKSSDIIAEPIQNEQVSDSVNLVEVKAPLVGTFYSSPKPDSPPFVNVGENPKPIYGLAFIYLVPASIP